MKKLIALIMAAVMVVSLSAIVFAEEDDGLLARYTFDEDKADDGLTENGTQLTYADGKVTLGDSSNSSYLESDLDLTGLEEITIGMKLTLPQDAGGGQWIYDITSQTSHDGQPNGAFGFGMYYENGTLHAQIYAGCNTPVPPTDEVTMYIADLPADELATVVVTYTADKILTVYVNDEMFGWDVYTDVDFADIIGSDGTPTLQIGRCSWGNGYYGRTIQIDEFSIYGRALTQEEVTDVFGITISEDDEDETTAGNDKVENAPTTTEAPTTEAPTTNAPADSGDSTTGAANDEGGCGSAMGAAAAIITITAVFGSAVIKRR